MYLNDAQRAEVISKMKDDALLQKEIDKVFQIVLTDESDRIDTNKLFTIFSLVTKQFNVNSITNADIENQIKSTIRKDKLTRDEFESFARKILFTLISAS